MLCRVLENIRNAMGIAYLVCAVWMAFFHG